MGFRMAGDAIDETDEQGNAITDDTLLVLLNAHDETVNFVLLYSIKTNSGQLFWILRGKLWKSRKLRKRLLTHLRLEHVL